LDYSAWKKCPTFDQRELDGRDCYAGLDLASKIDLSALVLLFPGPDESYSLVPFFWLPEKRIALRREPRMRQAFTQWGDEGHITLCPGDATDFSAIEHTIGALAERYRIVAIGFDPWNSETTAQRLQSRGLTCLKVHQGYGAMNEPAKLFEKLILSAKIAHNRHPVMDWMVSGVQVATDPAGNIKPIRPEHVSDSKIDGVVAALMALALASRAEPSVYSTRGILTL
jgi:phage terminase large subunit-like protein